MNTIAKPRHELFRDEFGQLGTAVKTVQTVDVRSEAEFEEGHLPGAVSLTPHAAPIDSATEVRSSHA